MPAPPGYLELLRANADFRRIWLGSVASFLGDWFNTIALYTLVRELTGSELALGLVFLTKLLPFALASPLAGLLVDRFDRKRLMIGTDLARAGVVLGFLLVDTPGEVALLYALSGLQQVLGAVFIPARTATIPNITTPEELLTANALGAATWSMLLTLGAALGGALTAVVGTDGVFLLDSATYLVSAALIARVAVPPTRGRSDVGPPRALAELVDGWRHLVRRPEIGRIALAKTAWAVGGAGLVYMLALMGERIWPASPSLGIGLLYAARGLGTGIGPIAARALFPDERRWPAVIGLGVAVTGLAYLATAGVPWSPWILLLVTLAHAPSGANWVLSTVLLQQRTEDRYRGRVFATEWLLLTLVNSITIVAASLVLETGGLELRTGIALFAGFQVLCGIAWVVAVVPAERRYREG